MRPVIVRRLGTAAAAAGLLVTVLAGCGSSPVLPNAGSTFPPTALPSGPVASATAAAGQASAAPSACSLLRQADVLAVAATFRGTTISIDGQNQASQPPLSKCGFNQKGVFADSDGITSTLSGDQWAQLTVIADGNDIGDYSPDGPVIHGLGNGAYWDQGRVTVVVLVGRNVFEVVDDVPANLNTYPDVAAARQQAATALAVRILSHLQAAS
jgi:hypothetical protein